MKTIWTVPGLLLAAVTAADEAPALSKEAIAAKLIGVTAEDIHESPIPGLLQVTAGSTIAYVTPDGRYLLQGELFDVDSRENLTEATRAQGRVEALAGLQAEDMIVFSPADGAVKHTVTVFTDIDCGYCRQFHREIAQATALGIEVRYLFYPRTGPDTESWDKAAKVWCADDRHTALTNAKLGGRVPDADCAETPVEAHYTLGQDLGVRGTPSMYAANGDLLGGYLPPATLLERLEDIAAR